MNKENYKRAFSQVRPSEETIERILNMPDKKSKSFKIRPLIAAAVTVSLLAGAMLTAHAAVDNGKSIPSDRANTVVQDSPYSTLKNVVEMIINGENVDASDYGVNVEEFVDENGNSVKRYNIDLPNGTKGGFECLTDGDETTTMYEYVEAVSNVYNPSYVAEE